jgi:hypothetical protein
MKEGTLTYYPLGSGHGATQIAASGTKVWLASNYPGFVAPDDAVYYNPPSATAADAAKLDRIRPPSTRGLQPQATTKVSIALPTGWQPLFLEHFAAQPEVVYVVARTGQDSGAVARVKLAFGGPVTELFELPACPYAACAASDGTLWVCCNKLHTTDQYEGWLVYCKTTAVTPAAQIYHDQARGLLGIVEGAEGRMFLLRHFADPTAAKPSQDIYLFKDSPIGGVYGPVGKIQHPKRAYKIEPGPDGSSWLTVSEPVSKAVYDTWLARFVPPDVDPLNPDT